MHTFILTVSSQHEQERLLEVTFRFGTCIHLNLIVCFYTLLLYRIVSSLAQTTGRNRDLFLGQTSSRSTSQLVRLR